MVQQSASAIVSREEDFIGKLSRALTAISPGAKYGMHLDTSHAGELVNPAYCLPPDSGVNLWSGDVAKGSGLHKPNNANQANQVELSASQQLGVFGSFSGKLRSVEFVHYSPGLVAGPEGLEATGRLGRSRVGNPGIQLVFCCLYNRYSGPNKSTPFCRRQDLYLQNKARVTLSKSNTTSYLDCLLCRALAGAIVTAFRHDDVNHSTFEAKMGPEWVIAQSKTAGQVRRASCGSTLCRRPVLGGMCAWRCASTSALRSALQPLILRNLG